MIIFTDGSARGNPGPGGWGAIVVGEDFIYELGGRENHTTNNRMELTAVISALESVSSEREFIVYTDSAYVLSGITRWVIGWKKNKWKTSKKEDVLNKDLWEKLVDAVSHKIIDWKLIKGHSGTGGNERCDIIATSFADNAPVVLYNGSKERYGVNLSVFSNSTESFLKEKTKKRKAYSYVSLVGGEVLVHKTWDECKARVHGISSAKYKKSISPEDEEKIIKEFTE
jgi:ribonuclease HI